MLDPTLLTLAAISGFALGSMYGLIALGFHVTHAVSHTVNFAQGSSVMLGAVLCYTFAVTLEWPVAAAIALALLLCAVWGLAVERVAVRPFAARGSNGWLMATVAVGIILENATMFIFGNEPRSLPSSLADEPIDVAGVAVMPLQILIPVIGLSIAFALHVLARRTRVGKAMLAVVQNPDAARLMGIDVHLVVAASYAISAVFAGVAGILIAPLFSVASDMGTLFGIKAFAVAIVGGIMSPWGVIVAGLAYGVVEAMVTALFGSAYTQILTFGAVIIALALMPNGLLGKAAAKKA